ncbi:hypothetical protein PMAYCL1PPCAC_03623, partial [Pristionchus mayeri]
FLLLPACSSRPLRVRRGGIEVGYREDIVLLSLTEHTDDPGDCYFKDERSTDYENVKNRPKTSAVGPCSVGPRRRMSELLDMTVDNLYQSPNALALVLMRGEGDYEVDWSNEAQVVGVGQRLICKKHIDELLTNWESTSYYHMRRKIHKGVKAPACSMPHQFWQHDSTVELGKKKMYFIEADEAEAILVEKGVLVHPGLQGNACRD